MSTFYEYSFLFLLLSILFILCGMAHKSGCPELGHKSGTTLNIQFICNKVTKFRHRKLLLKVCAVSCRMTELIWSAEICLIKIKSHSLMTVDYRFLSLNWLDDMTPRTESVSKEGTNPRNVTTLE